MLRSILLGLLTLGIIPIALADATATNNTKVIVPQKTIKLDQQLDSVPPCGTKKRSQDCFSNTEISDSNSSIDPTQSENSEVEGQEFPQSSRSSPTASLPTADNTPKPANTRLANPAPLTTRITSPFGWRTRPHSHQLQFHQGIDYGAPLGSPVVAVGDGIVTKIVSGCYDFGNLYCGGQLGNWIEIDHGNGRLGVYGHLKNSSITVKEGMKVQRNQEIAQVGSSGWSTGAHLDFRFKVNGEYEDPAKHVTAIDE